MPRSYSPIPGAGPRPRGLFIDRWGTLLELPEKAPCTRFDRARFVPGALDALFHAGQAGWNLYSIGNEDDVAFGRMAESTWRKFEGELLDHLRAHGVAVRRLYACLDHPEGVAPHDRDSVFLLPNTGALYHAAQTDGIVLEDSWVIGDGTLELVAGWRAGCHLAAVGAGRRLGEGELHVEPEIVADDLVAVLREVALDPAHRR